MQDPFSQANIPEIAAPGIPAADTANTETTKTVIVPEKPQYILGVEAKSFFGMFYGALIITIFFSLMESDQ